MRKPDLHLLNSIKEKAGTKLRKCFAPENRVFHGRDKRKTSAELEAAMEKLPPADPETGLTDRDVEERTALGLTNMTDRAGIRSTGEIILAHTFTWFNLLNLFLGFLIFLTGSYKDMLFLGIVICNTSIGIVQELRVRHMILNLNVITTGKASVLRNGVISDIPVEQVVYGEIIHLQAGDQVIADGPVISTDYLEVNESMLTGESKPVRKKPGEELMSGSFIVSGNAVMRADKVGRNSYAAQLVSQTKKRRRASSEMQNAIQKIIRYVSIALIPIGLLLYRGQHAAAVAAAAENHFDDSWVFAQSIVRTVSGMIGMIPEGLVLLTSVSFIIGVGRLAMKGALVQEMESIEGLARTDILCTDKTGTITTGKLRVMKLVTAGDTRADFVRNVMAHVGGAFKDSNDTQEALDQYFGKKKDWTVRASIPFSSERKYRAVSFKEYGSFVLGAPEILVPDCEPVLEHVEQYAKKGYRCLLLCSAGSISEERENLGKLNPLAVIVISDVIREDAQETFAFFANAGVRIKVLSGDNPATVSAVAQKAGVEGAEQYMDASKLPEDPALFAQAIGDCSVFGRVKPEQKQAFIKAWQESGHTVAMVGDGVNDVLAIKDADCGIAMANGSEAAKHAAHIVLLDSDFTAMKNIVGEGRTIICNIERVSALYLTKTIYSCILSIIFIFLAAAYPWTTLQMGLINIVGIGIPSFLLTLERHDDWRSGGFMIHVMKICLPSALTMVTTVCLIRLCSVAFNWDGDMYSYFSLMLGGMVSLLVVGQVIWPLNPYRRVIWIICAVVFIAAVLLLPNFYDIHSIWTPWTLLLIPWGLLISVTIYGYSLLTNKLTDRFLSRE